MSILHNEELTLDEFEAFVDVATKNRFILVVGSSSLLGEYHEKYVKYTENLFNVKTEIDKVLEAQFSLDAMENERLFAETIHLGQCAVSAGKVFEIVEILPKVVVIKTILHENGKMVSETTFKSDLTNGNTLDRIFSGTRKNAVIDPEVILVNEFSDEIIASGKYTEKECVIWHTKNIKYKKQ